MIDRPSTRSPTPLSLLYRGPLASCNYGCVYCPFAKRVDSREALEHDASALQRFVDRVCAIASAERPVRVLFTPWGEALIRRAYQRALVRLTHHPHVRRAAIQTNLSAPLGWVGGANPAKLGIWATYHPDWVERAAFVRKVRDLHERGVSVSAGVVGFLDAAEAIRALRAELPSGVYLWINANKRDVDYYPEADIQRFEAIDPWFRTNTVRHPSRGHACGAGHTALSVDGEGTVRRCHFVPEPLGNFYGDDWMQRLRRRACPADTCGCHIGYVHLERLGLASLYGENLMERVPLRWGA